MDLVVLDQAVDKTTPAGKLMFNMIGAFAEFERALAEERRNEGIARAKAKGIRFGRPRAIGCDEAAALRELAARGAKLREMADATGVLGADRQPVAANERPRASEGIASPHFSHPPGKAVSALRTIDRRTLLQRRGA